MINQQIYMLLRAVPSPRRIPKLRLARMASHLANGPQHTSSGNTARLSLDQLPKSNVFTSKLPPDPAFESPEVSHNAPREALGPRIVKGALFTYVRPEPSDEPELLGVSPKAMEDIGLKHGEKDTQHFLDVVSGNKIFWDQDKGGIYPWSQCYGGTENTLFDQKKKNYSC